MSAPMHRACRLFALFHRPKGSANGVLAVTPRGHNSFGRWHSSGTTSTFQKAAEVPEAISPTQMEAGRLQHAEFPDMEAESLKHADYFGVHDLVSVRDLFKARIHIGHKQGLRAPFMTPYLFGNRLGVDIIDLEQTLPLFQDALNFTAHIAYRGGVILFLSRNRQTLPLVERVAVESGEYAHCRFWKGGTLTNSTIQFSTVTRMPDLCIVVNTQNSVLNQHRAIIECAKLLIPTIGIVDTNCDPRLISYPIPGNDDTPVAVQYYCDKFKEAILRGKAKRKEDRLED